MTNSAIELNEFAGSPIRRRDGQTVTAAVDDERVLVHGLRAGEEWAFEAIVRRYGGRLLSVARRIVRNEEDARDVVQSAYLNACRGIRTFEGGAHIYTWLHRIVVNTALMKLRSRSRRLVEDPIDVLLPRFDEEGRRVDDCTEWTASPEHTLLSDELRAFVRSCIQRLPGGYREVLILRDIEEYSTREVAEQLAISTAAVKVRLHRARQALATLLRR